MGMAGEKSAAGVKEFDRFTCLNCGCIVDLSLPGPRDDEED
jgi:hypothetical protein